VDTIEQVTGSEPSGSVIWLHGLGADGSDFEPIVPMLKTQASLRFVFPNAPHRPVTINNGMVMPAWYDILVLGGGTEDEAGIRDSQERLEALITREIERGISPSRIVVAGFSQGGAIALQTGLRSKQPLAGIMALSTYLPLRDSLADEQHARADLPILMVHGQSDEVIPISRAMQSREHIEAAGFKVEWAEYPMGHEVCAPEIDLISDWLNRVLD
jgi:phospholipase/carboxylesterase